MFNTDKYKEIVSFLGKNGRNTEIIAISKNHPKSSVLEAIESGVFVFGENRVNEAKLKFVELREKFPKIRLHLTGPLQSNKVRDAVKIFDVFHTLDREKIAKEFSKYSEQLIGKKFFIQVNTGMEESKSGVNPKHIKSFKNFCINEMKLNVVGLMCIPPVDEKPKIHFDMLQNLGDENNLKELSIGMSNDYLDALYYNPSYIRLGTILFGARN